MEKTGRWTTEEQNKFEEAIKLFGNNWKKVHQYIGSRSSTQIRSHAQKYFNKQQNPQKNINNEKSNYIGEKRKTNIDFFYDSNFYLNQYMKIKDNLNEDKILEIVQKEKNENIENNENNKNYQNKNNEDLNKLKENTIYNENINKLIENTTYNENNLKENTNNNDNDDLNKLKENNNDNSTSYFNLIL